MTSGALVLAFKIVLIASFSCTVGWLILYTKLAPWWRDPIGRTLGAKSGLIALLLLPSILSIFFHLNRLTSSIAGWFDVAVLGSVAVVMIWRSIVFWKETRGRQRRRDVGNASNRDPGTPERHRPWRWDRSM